MAEPASSGSRRPAAILDLNKMATACIILRVDEDSRLTVAAVNTAASELIGRPEHEIVGADAYILGDAGTKASSLVRRIIETGEPIPPYESNFFFGGRTYTLSVTLSAAASDRSMILAEMHDVTAERAWFRSLVEDADHITTLIDRFGTVTYVAPAVEKRFGHPAEYVGLTARQLAEATVHPEDVDSIYATYLEVAKGDPGSSAEFVYRAAPGGKVRSRITNRYGTMGLDAVVIHTYEIE